uniref:Uncharacterized protein n=1 Tax=Anguilla anguilla TaxID=7936 RepID=A0A0E9VM60_ANGAN
MHRPSIIASIYECQCILYNCCDDVLTCIFRRGSASTVGVRENTLSAYLTTWPLRHY